MLKTVKGKRFLAVFLVAVTLIASAFAVYGMASAEKSTTATMFDTFGYGSVLTGKVDTGTGVTETEEVATSINFAGSIFESLNIVQTSIDEITVTGKLGTIPDDMYDPDGDGIYDIAITVGDDEVRSQIVTVQYDKDTGVLYNEATGKNNRIKLNHVFCMEFGNVIPISFSYSTVVTGVDGESYKANIVSVGTLAVITYDYDTGILGYPAGAQYVDAQNGHSDLGTKYYVPADAAKVDGKVTVIYNDLSVSFEANTAAVADTPADYGKISDVGYNFIKLNSVSGLQYGYTVVGGAIGENYGAITWLTAADADTLKISDLLDDTYYTVWVRTPATDTVLASSPVFMGKVKTLSESDGLLRDAFLDAYAMCLEGEKKLYTTEDPNVTAETEKILTAIGAYYALPEGVKLQEVVAEKAAYLEMSYWLSKYQDIVAAVRDADTYAELRDKYNFDQLSAAFKDVCVNTDPFSGKLYLNLFFEKYWGTADEDFILDVSMVMQKLFALLEVSANDAAKDAKYTSVDLVYDKAAAAVEGLTDEQRQYVYFSTKPEESDAYTLMEFYSMYCEDYEFGLFEIKYAALFAEDAVYTIEALETMLEEFETVSYQNYYFYDVMIGFQDSLADIYVEKLTALLDKYDEEEVIYHMIESAIAGIRDDSGDEPWYNGYPTTSYIYYDILNLVDAYDAYVKAYDAIEALMEGKHENVANALRTYLDELDMLWENDFYDISIASDPDAALADFIAACEEINAKAVAHVEFFAKKASIYAAIEALKDGDKEVDAVADKYLALVSQFEFDYNDIEVINASLDKAVADATAEAGFEKSVDAAVKALAGDLAARKASGKYSASQALQLESIFNEGVILLQNLDYLAGKTVADVDAQKAATLAKYDTVNVISASVGEVPFAGDMSKADYPAGYGFADGLWGNVTNMNGFGSALALKITKTDVDEKLVADKVVVASGEVTEDEAIAATTDKDIVFKFNVGLEGAPDNNGLYTVKVLLPADQRETAGLYVVSQADGTTYVYETVREGNYLVFKTAKLGEFMLVSDRVVSMLWLIIILEVLLVVEIGLVVFFIIKKKKGTVASIVALPFLAIVYSPAGTLVAVIVLGALATVGAGVATVVTVKSVKKKN